MVCKAVVDVCRVYPDQSLSLIRMNSDQDNVPTSRPSSWRLQGVDQDDLGESRPSSWNSARSDFPPPTPETTSRANSLSLDSSAAKKQAEALSKILEDTLSSRLDEFKSSEQLLFCTSPKKYMVPSHLFP